MSLKKKKTFMIVHFTESVNNEEKCIDCVPSMWVFLDKKKCQIMTKFMPPPYTVQKCNTLHKLVKDKENAPDKWPSYPVQILGHAGMLLFIYCKLSHA